MSWAVPRRPTEQRPLGLPVVAGGGCRAKRLGSCQLNAEWSVEDVEDVEPSVAGMTKSQKISFRTMRPLTMVVVRKLESENRGVKPPLRRVSHPFVACTGCMSFMKEGQH